MMPSTTDAVHPGSMLARERSHREDLADVCALIHDSYLETPGLCLTFRQAMRLWNLDDDHCKRALEALVADGLLQLSPDGMYRAPNLM